MAIYKLKDLGEFKGGISTLDKTKYDSGILFINYTDIFNNISIKEKSKIRLYDATENDIRKYNVQYGDLLFTASSETPEEIAMSSVYMLNEDAIFNGFSKRYRYDQEILKPKYASYLFRALDFRGIVSSLASGYTRYNISQKSLENIEVSIPMKDEQQKIIDIIEPIEILEMNLELVNSKLNLLIKNLELKNQRVKIKDISKLIRYKEQGIKQISAKKLNTSNPIIIEDEPIGTYKTNSFHCPKGTLVINTIRTYLRKFGILDNDLDANGTLIQLIIDKEFETTILSSLLNDDFWNETILLSQGTKMPVIKKSDLLNIEIPLVKNEIEGIFKLYISISLMKRKLSQMKKSLIQILIK